MMNFKTPLSLKRNPFDIVLWKHRVLNFAHGNTDYMSVSLKRNNGNVLFASSIDRSCHELLKTSRCGHIARKRSKNVSRLIFIEYGHVLSPFRGTNR